MKINSNQQREWSLIIYDPLIIFEWDQWNGGAMHYENWNRKQKQRATQILFLKFLPYLMRARVTRIANQRCESKINTRNANTKVCLACAQKKRVRNRANSTPSEIMRFLFDLHLRRAGEQSEPRRFTKESLSLFPVASNRAHVRPGWVRLGAQDVSAV
jgi:hypothetical protein